MNLREHIRMRCEQYRALVYQHPPLDRAERGEQGVLDYAEAVDKYLAYKHMLQVLDERLAAQVAEACPVREPYDMDDCVVYPT